MYEWRIMKCMNDVRTWTAYSSGTTVIRTLTRIMKGMDDLVAWKAYAS